MCENHEHHHDEDCCCECCEEEKELVRDRRELTDEEIESIIVEKYNTKDEKTKVFIRKALKKQGDWYDYSKAEYTGLYNETTIMCPIHGEFLQKPCNHYDGAGGCRECSGKVHYDTNSFINKAKSIHGDRYNYGKTEYVNNHTKITITCSIHGDFEQDPKNHLQGQGCPKCGGSFKYTTEEFILKAKEIHKDKYKYDKVEYKDIKSKVIIHCDKHGDFEQIAEKHLDGCGCPDCANEDLSRRYTKTTEQFIDSARKIHGNLYDYSKVNYVDCRSKVIIHCNKHGDFEQSPTNHLAGNGCPKCSNSIGEILTENYLTDRKISYEQHVKIDYDKWCMIPDFILADNIWLEYNGLQHYFRNEYFHKNISDFIDQLNRDIRKREYCKNNNIRLIEIPYTLKTIVSISDFLDKVLLQNIDPNTLVDYSKLYKLDNTGFKIEDLFPT